MATKNFNLDDRNRFYYKRVYLGCVRANDFIFSLPQFDGVNLAVTGGSQGGALSIITAGLDPRVKHLAAYYPALSDVTGYLKGRAGGCHIILIRIILLSIIRKIRSKPVVIMM
jgi:cephalosporin-C deacetylase-like acetyl esterase